MLIEHASDKLTGVTLGNYRLERLLGYSQGGRAFLARSDSGEATLLRFLGEPANQEIHWRNDHLERFQYLASRIVALQHPYILSLLDYGVYQGMPYVVSPYLTIRSLRSRLTNNGPMNALTVGRYLDQITAALEYAHEHSVLHGDLTLDCIFLRLDGRLVVADFGVRDLLELNSPGKLLTRGSQGCAPELLLGKPTGPYTDVYALGAIVYQLLTGSPVFAGTTPDEISQQHLFAAVPPFSQTRSDLPSGLYSIIARALAKEPKQRYQQPGALANAYHRVVNPQDRNRMPFVVNTLPTLQGQQSLRPDGQLTEHEWNSPGSVVKRGDSFPGQVLQTPFPPMLKDVSDADFPHLHNTRRVALLHRLQRKNTRHTAAIALLLLLLLVASTIVGTILISSQFAARSGLSGQVTFFDGSNTLPEDTQDLSIVIQGLKTPPSGSQYDAWFINDQSEQVLALGPLTEQHQTYALTYTSSGTNLLEAGDRIEITLEHVGAKLPSGNAVLIGKFPVQAFAHIQHLLVGFPTTPGKVGMLVGLTEQTHELNIQADVLQSLVSTGNSVAIRCVAQNIINLIEGTHGSHYRPLAAQCLQQNITAAGDGFGLLGQGFLADAAEHATLAITQPDATSSMRLHAGLMGIALSNIKGWVTSIDQDSLHIRENPADLSKVSEINALANAAYYGADANGNGQVNPVAGEAGALTAYQQGELMATLSLTPNA